MSRRRGTTGGGGLRPAAPSRLLVLTVVLLAGVVPASVAHEGNPEYRSTVRAIEPAVDGLRVEVLSYDDRLSLRNDSGREIVVRGYRDEPYARLLADGTVQVNRRSPALYLNDDRFADVEVPPEADAGARPEWETKDRSGLFEWHDHRMHWMGRNLPPQVKDEEKHTKVFDWSVPIEVDGRAGRVRGDLFWTPLPDEGFSLGARLALAALALAGAGLAVTVQRRRRRRAAAGPRGEAW